MSENLFKQMADGTIRHEKEINDLNTLSHAKACLCIEPEMKVSPTDYELFDKEGLQSLIVFEQVISLLSKSTSNVLHAYSGRGVLLDLLSESYKRYAEGIEPDASKIEVYSKRCAEDIFIDACPCHNVKVTEFTSDKKFDLIIVTPGILLPREKSSMRLALKDFGGYTDRYAADIKHLQQFLTERGFLVAITQDFYAAKTFFNTLVALQQKVEGVLQLRGMKIFPKPVPYEKKQFLTDYVPLLNYCSAGIFTNLTN